MIGNKNNSSETGQTIRIRLKKEDSSINLPNQRLPKKPKYEVNNGNRNREGSLASAIKKLLNNNPLTLREIRFEINKMPQFVDYSQSTLATTLFTQSDICSEGPHGHKKYYLKGQELYEQNFPEILRLDRRDVEIKILEYLLEPMTKADLVSSFEKDGYYNHDNLINSSLKKLWREREVWRIKFDANTRSGQKYSAYKLFGCLAGKTIYCIASYPDGLIDFIQSKINLDYSNKGFNAARTMRLRRILPKVVFDLLQ